MSARVGSSNALTAAPPAIRSFCGIVVGICPSYITPGTRRESNERKRKGDGKKLIFESCSGLLARQRAALLGRREQKKAKMKVSPFFRPPFILALRTSLFIG
jgi:hypothetical protein